MFLSLSERRAAVGQAIHFCQRGVISRLRRAGHYYRAAAQFSTAPGLAPARLGEGRIPPARHRNCTLKSKFCRLAGLTGEVGSSALGHFSAAAKWRLRLPDERWVL